MQILSKDFKSRYRYSHNQQRKNQKLDFNSLLVPKILGLLKAYRKIYIALVTFAHEIKTVFWGAGGRSF